MRKTFIILMLLTIVVVSCDDNQIKPTSSKVLNPMVSKFSQSREFSVRKSFLEKLGKIDFDQTMVDYVTVESENYATLLIPITSKGKVVAQLQVVDLVAAAYLPNGETYAMNLINLMDYNVAKGTGRVKMFDLNYENHEHSEIDFVNNKVRTWRYNQLPEKLSLKYVSLRKHRTGLANAKGGGVSCDPNKDGNVGFFECTACIKDAIAQNAASDFICDVPVAGWVGCFTSVTAACVVISSVY